MGCSIAQHITIPPTSLSPGACSPMPVPCTLPSCTSNTSSSTSPLQCQGCFLFSSRTQLWIAGQNAEQSPVRFLKNQPLCSSTTVYGLQEHPPPTSQYPELHDLVCLMLHHPLGCLKKSYLFFFTLVREIVS